MFSYILSVRWLYFQDGSIFSKFLFCFQVRRTKNSAGKHFPGNQLCARGLRGLCSSVKMARWSLARSDRSMASRGRSGQGLTPRCCRQPPGSAGQQSAQVTRLSPWPVRDQLSSVRVVTSAVTRVVSICSVLRVSEWSLLASLLTPGSPLTRSQWPGAWWP